MMMLRETVLQYVNSNAVVHSVNQQKYNCLTLASMICNQSHINSWPNHRPAADQIVTNHKLAANYSHQMLQHKSKQNGLLQM